jgi:hypothetical protein
MRIGLVENYIFPLDLDLDVLIVLGENTSEVENFYDDIRKFKNYSIFVNVPSFSFQGGMVIHTEKYPIFVSGSIPKEPVNFAIFGGKLDSEDYFPLVTTGEENDDFLFYIKGFDENFSIQKIMLAGEVVKILIF